MAQKARSPTFFHQLNPLFDDGLKCVELPLVAGGTCPTCRHDPVQGNPSSTRPAALEPASSVGGPGELHLSIEQVRPMDSDSDERVSSEPNAEMGERCESGAAGGSAGVDNDGAQEETHIAVSDIESCAGEGMMARADENAVSAWSPGRG